MGKFSLKNLLSSGVDKVIDSVGNTIDKISTTKEEKIQAKGEVIKTLTTFTTNAFEIQKELMLAEMHGNKYQRSWRPTLMYMCIFIIFNTLFLFPLLDVFVVDNKEFTEYITQVINLKPFWNVLAIGTGAIGIARSGEKIARNFFERVDNKKK